MQAIVFADRIGKELGHLCDYAIPANLSFLNRPLLEHCLNKLSDVGIDNVLLVVSEDIDVTRQYFRDGVVYGVSIEYIFSRGQENPNDVIQRIESRLEPSFFVLRGDIYQAHSLSLFVEKARGINGNLLEASIDGQAAGIAYVRRWPVDLSGLGWPMSFVSSIKVALTVNHFSLLDTPKEYFTSQMGLLTVGSTVLPDTATRRDEGLWVEPLGDVDSRSLWTGRSLIGENTFVHKSALLKEGAVVGRDCYISRGVRITNSIILPGTYIGKNLDVENAIVVGGYIHSLETNTDIEISDPALLAYLSIDVQSVFRMGRERITAIALLLLSLPLWPIAIVASWDVNNRTLMSRERILGNRARKQSDRCDNGIIEVWRFRTFIPVLRSLPKLIPVILGDLRLFGYEPVRADQLALRANRWDDRLQMRAAGLLGPKHLELSDTAPEEQIRLAEVIFIKSVGLKPLLKTLYQSMKLLFSYRSWMVSHKSRELPK